MNYMEQVAKMLGVDLGEHFEINKNVGVFTLCNDGLVNIQGGFMCNELLSKLLSGKYAIKRKPWKPKEGERYYFVSMNEGVLSDTSDNVTVDALLYKIGNCYKTKEEAEANYKKWQEFYKSDEVLEV